VELGYQEDKDIIHEKIIEAIIEIATM